MFFMTLLLKRVNVMMNTGIHLKDSHAFDFLFIV